MMVGALHHSLRKRLKSSEPLPPHGTVLCRAAGTVLTMADAYCRDGASFMGRGDLANGAACIAYALGWLDTGAYLGIVLAEGDGSVPLLEDRYEGAAEEFLARKTCRYEILLAEAIGAVVVAAEEESEVHEGAAALVGKAAGAHERGLERQRTGDLLNALVQFSYGHGWLDAGIRTGFLRIHGRRELFTI
ncbi:MAG: DUF357 domain-containing protein [Methanomicrobiales archaeon]|nr:DUF357 domain-containing protein [Methanomicrobiales archaeon]